jgi:hypothetical protein
VLRRRRPTAAAIRADALLEWFNQRAGSDPEFTLLDQHRTSYPITCLRYVDVPEPGSTVAATMGLSFNVDDGGPELVMLVGAVDPAWAWALGAIAEQIQGEVDLEEGSTVDFRSQICEGSAMSAFVFVRPLILDEGESEVIHTPAGHVVLWQAIPLYSSEMEHLRAEAHDRSAAAHRLLRELGSGLYDVTRPPIR